MLKKLLFILLLNILVIPASFASTITPGVYEFFDHPDGALSSFGPYGLRLDFLDKNFPGKGKKGPTFSVELGGASVFLDWDGVGSASISGTIYHNVTGDLWTVEHVLEDITLQGDGGFTAASGDMTLTDPFNTVYIIESKQNGDGDAFIFAADNHRCDGYSDCGPINARGWLNNHGTNDWLVQATLIPIPAALPMFLFGLMSLLGIRKITQ